MKRNPHIFEKRFEHNCSDIVNRSGNRLCNQEHIQKLCKLYVESPHKQPDQNNIKRTKNKTSMSLKVVITKLKIEITNKKKAC